MKSLYLNVGFVLVSTVACIVLFSLVGLFVNRIVNPTTTHFLRPHGAINMDAMPQYYWVRNLFLALGAIGGFVTAQILWILHYLGKSKLL